MQNADWTDKKQNIVKRKQFIFLLKMDKEILTFGNSEIEKKNLPP